MNRTLLSLLILAKVFISTGFDIFPQTWSAAGVSNCGVVVKLTHANITLDRDCIVERTLLPDASPIIEHLIGGERLNSQAESYYRLSMKTRFTMPVDVASNESFYGRREFSISVGSMRVLFLVMSTDQLKLDSNFMNTGWSTLEYRSAYIENIPVHENSFVKLLFTENVSKRAGYDFDGYMELIDVKMDRVYIPPKCNTVSPLMWDATEVSEHPRCLMHSSHSTVLKKIILNTFVDKSNYPSVFCGVFTHGHNHANVKAIRDTWGRRCTGFLAFSDVEDLSIPTIHIPHVGEESYRNMWQKVRAMWKYVYRHYRDEYEYFLFGGDDMYYVMDNLYGYLGSAEIRAARDSGQGLYLGREFFSQDENLSYNTGGPGYLLDHTAFKLIGSTFDRCSPLYVVSAEDLVIGYCLRELLNITPYRTADEHNRQRWHNLSPGYLAGPLSSGLVPKNVELDNDIHLKYGEQCCSHQSIAFHHIDKDLMYQIEEYLYRCRK